MDISLLHKLREHTLSPEEEEEVQRWAKGDARRLMYMERFIQREQGENYNLSEHKMGLYRTDFIKNLNHRRRKRTHNRLRRIMYGAAAATIVAILSFYYPYRKHMDLRPAAPVHTARLKYEDCCEDLKMPKESNADVTVEKDDDGMKEIIVGRGAEFKVELADGTLVWLNSDTRLLYPEQFGGTERKVILDGEAYFAVEKDRKKPFIVHAKGVDIKVYGTEFNVTAREEGHVRTTLVSGSVSVKIEGELQETILTPGLTAEMNPDTHQLNVSQHNTDLYAGWKDGRFSFEETPLEDLFGELALWYDLQVDFETPDAGRECFTGSLSRHMSLVDLLRALQSTTYVSFRLEGRHLTVGKSLQDDRDTPNGQ